MGSSIPAFPLKSQSFSKRVDQQDLLEGKLKIPKIALRKYGKCMAADSLLFLKVPNGGVWPIELKLCTEGRFWLQEGWPRFANFYSLDHGYTLRFKCQDESSCFLKKQRGEVARFLVLTAQVVIPKAVAEAEGLTGNKKLLLLDPFGEPWDVKLFAAIDGRLLMTKGWRKCYNENQIP